MKTFDNQEILIEKEYALAGAKLIQQFQKLLMFIKNNLQPVFCDDENTHEKIESQKYFQESNSTMGDSNPDDKGNKLFSMISGIFQKNQKESLISSNELRQNLVNDKQLIANFKSELKKFERLLRVFEMTHLDLTQKLRENVKQKNLEILPEQMKVKQDVKINEKGQIIIANGDNQLFDGQAMLIDKNSRINVQLKGKKRSDSSQERMTAFMSTHHTSLQSQTWKSSLQNSRFEQNFGSINQRSSNTRTSANNGSGFKLSLSPSTRVKGYASNTQQHLYKQSISNLKGHFYQSN